MNRKMIIDTDIGDDIDDAFAIALAAKTPGLGLTAVTTVFRNTKARAPLAEKLLAAAGVANIEVFAGEGIPVKEEIRTFEKDKNSRPEEEDPCQWTEEYASFPVKKGAADYLIRAAEEYGKELTIVAIGPLTNLARAIGRAPGSMKKVGKIICMGGSFTKFMPEWNVLCDPEATQTVYSSGIPFYAVGLDVTLKCPLEQNLLEAFRNSDKPVNRLLSLWLGRWFDYFGFEKSVMHDPLAVACCFEEVCKFKEKFVKVDLENTRGAVCVSDAPQEGYYPVFVAEEVDKDRFYAAVKERLL